MTEFLETPQVYLVGAGPGDPDLLTVRAHRIVASADILVHDRLVGNDILDIAPAKAQRIFVGKETGRHPVPQQGINALLVGLAHPGQVLVRLKGGDPFIFGRGGEEVEALRANGIPCEVIPGITAASGCLTEIGVPLTHRGLASSVRLVTGHRGGDGPLELDWAGLADPDTTLVFYMALANLPEISRRLIEAGLPGDTPAAAVSGGTTAARKVCKGTLLEIPRIVERAGLKPPALIVIGRVAAMAEAGAGRHADITERFARVVREAGHA